MDEGLWNLTAILEFLIWDCYDFPSCYVGDWLRFFCCLISLLLWVVWYDIRRLIRVSCNFDMKFKLQSPGEKRKKYVSFWYFSKIRIAHYTCLTALVYGIVLFPCNLWQLNGFKTLGDFPFFFNSVCQVCIFLYVFCVFVLLLDKCIPYDLAELSDFSTWHFLSYFGYWII